MSGIKLTAAVQSEIFGGMHTMLRAGYPLSDSAYVLSEEWEGRAEAPILRSLAQRMEEGESLSVALEAEGCFDAYTVGLVETGEQVGRLEDSLGALSEYFGRRAALSRHVRRSLTYPVMLALLTLAVVVVLVTKVIPVFDRVYASLGGTMSGEAGMLLRLGVALGDSLPYIGIGASALILIGIVIALIPGASRAVKGAALSLFDDRGIMKKINNASFIQALSMVVASGMPYEDGVGFAAKLIADSPRAARRAESCARLVGDGTDLDEALRSCGFLPPSCGSILRIGLRAGSVESALEDISSRLGTEAEESVDALVGMIEPALVVITSLVTGAVLLTVMLPLVNIMKVI